MQRLRIRILWILKVPKIHEFLRILKLSILKFIKFKLSHSLLSSSNKFFVANTALNFWIKSSVMSTNQDSLTRQQFCTIMSRAAYYKVYTNRLQLHCLPQCQNHSPRSWLPTVPIQRLPQCNRLLVLWEFENFAVTSDAIKQIFTNFNFFLNSRIFTNFKHTSHEFLIHATMHE